MQLLLTSPHYQSLQLRGLCFSFPVGIEILRGSCDIAVQGQMQCIEAPTPALLWPLETFTLIAAPDSEIVFRILPAGAIHAIPPLSAPLRRPTSAALALEVFRAPQRDWHANAASCALKLDGRIALSRRLLSEGQCLREIVLTQRLMRILFEIGAGCTPLETPAEYGFPDRSSIENALYDRFRISTTELQRISFSARQSHSRIAA